MKKLLQPLLFIACALLWACEYDNTDVNYNNIEPPSPNYSFMFDLASVPPGEPIYVYAATYLYYELGNIPENADYTATWYLDGEYWTNGMFGGSDPRPFLYFDPNSLSQGDHTLKLVIVSNTGTGSLAELLDMEKYVGEQTFTLRVGTTDRKLNIRQEITPEGRLKIVWDKPDLRQVEVEKYLFKYTDKQSGATMDMEIAGSDATEWIDPAYVYGYQEIRMSTIFRDNKLYSWEEVFDVKSPSFDSDNFITEDAGWGKVRIWMKPYPYDAVFEISIGDDFSRRMTVDDFPIVVDRPLFPDELTIKVRFFYGDGERAQGEETVNIPYPSLPAAWIIFPSTFDNTIYLDNREKRLLALDADNLEVVHDITIADFTVYDVIYHFQSDLTSSRKAMVLNNMAIRFYRDGLLTAPKVVASGLESISGAAFARDGRFYVFGRKMDWYTNTATFYLLLYDADTGELMDTKQLPTYTSMNTSAQFSVDGRYIMILNSYGMDAVRFMDIYELDGTQMTLVKSFTAAEAGAAAPYSRWHSTDPRLLMFCTRDQTNGRITLMRVPSFEAVSAVDGIVVATDPFTGNIYYRNPGGLGQVYTIASPLLDRSLFEFSELELRGTPILNNRLFNPNGNYGVNYYDLSPYLAH